MIATYRAEYRAKRLAQQKKKQRNKKTRQQYKTRSLQAIQQTIQQVIPPTSKQEATQPPKQKQRQEREQCNAKTTAKSTAKNIAEKAITSCSSIVNTSLLPTVPHQASENFDKEPASHCSSNKSHGYNFIRLGFLVTKHYHYAWLASLLGYMEYAKEMEATGQI